MKTPKGTRYGGRAKGTPNRKTQTLMEICEEEGIDPFRALLKMSLSEEPSIAMQALKEICQYIYPKRKALEVSGDLNLNPYADKSIEELEKLVKEKMD